MRNDDPLRLKQMRGAPPELVRALEALRKGANETARLERVASKLGPLLDAPPNPSPSAGSTPLIATAIKLIVGALALLIPALFILRSERSEKPRVAVLANESAKPALPVPEAPLDPVAAPRREPARPLPVATEPVANAAPVDHANHDKARATPSIRTHAHPPPTAARSSATATAVSTAETPTPNPAPAAVAQASQPSGQNANAPGSEPRAVSVQQPKAASVATLNPVVRAEAELLFDARRAMPSDAARALRLLEEHEKHYPNGRLVPEREVLAIEALRSLGRKAEADARLRRFEARYPDSFHLQRLQH
jgi:hypothetical protein